MTIALNLPATTPAFSDPAQDAITIAAGNDTLNYTVAPNIAPRGIYIGTGGSVSVQMMGGEKVLFNAVPQGVILPIRVQAVYATGTTASNMLGLF